MERDEYLNNARSLRTSETFGTETEQFPVDPALGFETSAWKIFLSRKDGSEAIESVYGHRNVGQAVNEAILSARENNQRRILVDTVGLSLEQLIAEAQRF